MKYVFTNGNDRQKELWRDTPRLFLYLPSKAIPLTVNVSFVPASEVNKQTTLAQTEWAQDDLEGSMLVRNSAPGFGSIDAGLIAEARALGLDWDQVRFYQETSAHELGHAIFAAIPHSFRLKVARLFGADTDDPEELEPPDKPWQRRTAEAIAEVFKEAFLPARHRVFPNRTSIKLRYTEYPKFRRLIREGLTAIGRELVIPEFDADIWGIDPKVPVPGIRNYVQGFPDKHGKVGLHRVRFGDEDGEVTTWAVEPDGEGGYKRVGEEGGHAPRLASFTEQNSQFKAWVPDGTVLRAKGRVPLATFTAFSPYEIDDVWGFGSEPSGFPFSFTLTPLLESALQPYAGKGTEFWARFVQYVYTALFWEFNPYFDGDPLENQFIRRPPGGYVFRWVDTTAPDDFVRNLFQPVLNLAAPLFRNEGQRPTRAEVPAWEEEHGSGEPGSYQVWPYPEGVDEGVYCYEDTASLDYEATFDIDKRWTTTKECNGRLYRLVKVESLLLAELPLSIGPSVVNPQFGLGPPVAGSGYNAQTKLAQEALTALLPTFELSVKECGEGGGTPIVVPGASVISAGSVGGDRAHPRPVSGSRA